MVKGAPSVNPCGRPKASQDARRLWEAILAEMRDDGITNAEFLLRRYYALACDDAATARDAANRLLGKVPDQVELRHERVVLDWGDAGADDAAASLPPAADSQESTAVQGGGVRPEMGQDAAGSSDGNG